MVSYIFEPPHILLVEMTSPHLIFLWCLSLKLTVGLFLCVSLPFLWAWWKVYSWEVEQRCCGKAGRGAGTRLQEVVWALHSALKQTQACGRKDLGSRASWKVKMFCWQIWTVSGTNLVIGMIDRHLVLLPAARCCGKGRGKECEREIAVTATGVKFSHLSLSQP